MKKYRSKPVEIEAVRFIDANFEECEEFVGGDSEFRNGRLLIATITGPLWVNMRDWIIKGLVEGEFYPCKDSVFQKKYEVVE